MAGHVRPTARRFAQGFLVFAWATTTTRTKDATDFLAAVERETPHPSDWASPLSSRCFGGDGGSEGPTKGAGEGSLAVLTPPSSPSRPLPSNIWCLSSPCFCLVSL